ncbi:hypothetical protein [Nocardioides sp. Leaf285]|uniref:hypothetical protein n=1 Tax=Nocardioides sp. Leaf285 TaxID=1736322 RepID=UPI0012E9ABBC|nr:hypothetical protein [Nocardioides sp. Leaf285]
MPLPLATCSDPLIHRAHDWQTSEQVDPDGDLGIGTDAHRFIEAWCEGNDDQDDPLFRFECCSHCASTQCPRRDGHASACSEGCPTGTNRLGEPAPAPSTAASDCAEHE